MSISDDEEVPELSAASQAALHEFFLELYKHEVQDNRLKLLASETLSDEDITIAEDWQLSQFWYDDKTIDVLVDVTLNAVGPSGRIALISCPTLYKRMRQKAGKDHEITLFEFDERFSIYGKDFVSYDYRSPLSIPREKSSYYDIVLADPPYFSEECLTKTAVTIKFLTKGKIILCTGAIMADLVLKLLNLQRSSFEPTHRNNLANEFWCYSNFSID